MPAPLSPITAPEADRRMQASPEPRRGPRLMLDPLLTLAVTGYRILRAALANPVDSLRGE